MSKPESATSTLVGRFEQGCKMAAQGKVSEALGILSECVATEPANADFVDAWLELLVNNAPATEPEERPAALAALSRQSADEHWDEVLQQGQLLLRDFPQRVSLLQTLATAAASLGHFEAADCYLAAALAIAPQQAELLRQRAKLLAQLRRYDEALTTWMELERVSPEDQGAAGAIASLTIERSRRRSGLKRRSEDYRATEPKPRVRLEANLPPGDRVYGSLATPALANAPVQRSLIQELELAVREFPSHGENYLQLVPLYLERNRDQDAERLLNRGRSATNNDPRIVALWEQVAVKCLEDRVVQARRDAAEHPSATTQTTLAQILRERDRLETAVYSSRLQREPDNLALHYELGVRLKRSAKLRDAIKHLELALGDPNERALAAFELGECQFQFGDVAQALHFYRLAAETALAEQAACRKQALYQSGVLALRMKLPKNAARYLRELVRIDPRYRDAASLLLNLQTGSGAIVTPPLSADRRLPSSSPTV